MKCYKFRLNSCQILELSAALLLFCLCCWPLSPSSAQNYVTYETCTWLYRGNPQDCRTYFQCNFGAALLRDCPPGLYWNVNIMNCDWPRNVRLGQDCGDPSLEQDRDREPQQPAAQLPPTAGDTTGIDSNVLEDTVIIDPAARSRCQEGAFSANPSDCGTYFVCNHGGNRLQQCGPGLHWNAGLTTCDWPRSARCTGSSATTGSPVTVTTTSTWRPDPPQTIGTATTSRPLPPAPTSTPSPFDESAHKVICYFTDWAWYREGRGKFLPANIDGQLCTHVIYAFAVLDANNWVPRAADTWADIDNKFYEQVTSLKKLGVKVTLALGGWNDSGGNKYSQLVNDPRKRATFVKATVNYLRQYNFDGIDLDWEYPTCWQGNCDQGPRSDKDGFTALVRELREALPPGSIVSAAVSANKKVVDLAYDVPSLSKYLDWIGVMDYDFHGGWEKETGHIAPLYFNPGDAMDYLNVNFSINYWISKGAPPSKLVMGIPLYGQSFTLANSKQQRGLNAPATGPGQAGLFTKQSGILAYYEICSTITSWEIVQNQKGTMGPYGVSGNQWVSFDDVAMVRKKADYIKAMGLGGGMVWALDFDNFDGSCGQGRYPLLSAISSVLKTNGSKRRPS